MQKAYKISTDQKMQIEHTKFSDASFFNPVQDINGDWFVFEVEMEAAVLTRNWKRAVLTDYVAPEREIIS